MNLPLKTIHMLSIRVQEMSNRFQVYSCQSNILFVFSMTILSTFVFFYYQHQTLLETRTSTRSCIHLPHNDTYNHK